MKFMLLKKIRKIFNLFSLWFCLWTKRLFSKPFFLFTLLLIPCAALFIQNSKFSDDSILRIAICIDGEEPDSASKNLENELIQLSGKAVKFYPQTSPENIYQDVSSGKAVSGYILPADLEEKVKNFSRQKTPFLTAVQKEAEMSNQIVNEILLSKLYQTHAYQILADFISEKNSPADTGFLEERFRSYQKHELLFRFEYADGTENKILGGSSAGLLLMPLRGMISVILFLSCMAGALMEYADRRTGLSYVIGTEKNLLCLCSSIFVPAFFAGIIGVLSIHVTEIAEPLQTESISMLCFLFACTSLVYFLSCAIKTREIFLSFLPVLTIGSLLLCPVFIDISTYSPLIKMLRYLFPVHYYLRSMHSTMDRFELLIYGILFLSLGTIWKKLRKLFKTDFQKL